MSNPWFRLYHEYATDPVIQVMSFDNQRHYVMLLCLKCDGVIDRPITLKNKERIIQKALGIDEEILQKIKKTFQEINLIDKNWQPKGWNKRQFISDHSAERMRKLRKNKETCDGDKPSLKRNLPVTVTDQIQIQNRYRTDTDLIKTPLPPKPNGKTKTGTGQARRAVMGKPLIEIREIFQCWQTTLSHDKANLDPKREKKIAEALGWGYSKGDLMQAIRGCSLTPHNMGHNDQGQKYDSLELILRDADHIDRFIRNEKHPPKPLSKADIRQQQNLQVSKTWADRKREELRNKKDE